MTMARARRQAEETEAEMTCHDELVSAAVEADSSFQKYTAGEDPQSYLKRLTQACSNIDDAAWNELTDPTQEWFNSAVDAIHNKDEIDLPEGFTPSSKPARKKTAPEAIAEAADKKRRRRQAAEETEEAEEKPAGRRRQAAASEEADEAEEKPARGRRKAAAESDDEKPKKVNGTGGRRGRGGSAVATIRQFVIRKPGASIEQIQAHLDKKGVEASPATVSATKNFTMSVINDAKEAGLWAE